MIERIRISELPKRVIRSSIGKQKGGEYERQVCKLLSLWVSGGQHVDLYWRSAMSGGRATRANGAVRQSGDITAVAPEGHVLTDHCFIECKHHRDLGLRQLLLGRGPLAQFWLQARRQAALYGRKTVLIAKQNLFPALVLTEVGTPFYTAA